MKALQADETDQGTQEILDRDRNFRYLNAGVRNFLSH